MTALERATEIVNRLERTWDVEILEALVREEGPWEEELRDAIHRACVEHSNAELERRRTVEARLREAHELLWAVVETGAHHGLPVEIRARITKVLEGRND